MPNYCNYEMKIVGSSENVDKMVSYLQADYNWSVEDGKYTYKELTADRHFFRVFEANEIEDSRDTRTNGLTETNVYGYCAWSVLSCMFKECTGTYCGDHKDDAYDNGFRGTHMVEATKDLGLVVEIFSEEPGCEFMEHFIVDKGEIKEQDCVDWSECYDDDGEPILDDNGCQVSEGGLEWEFTI